MYAVLQNYILIRIYLQVDIRYLSCDTTHIFTVHVFQYFRRTYSEMLLSSTPCLPTARTTYYYIDIMVYIYGILWLILL